MIPITIIFTYVYGHQNYRVYLEELTVLMQMNVECEFRENSKVRGNHRRGNISLAVLSHDGVLNLRYGKYHQFCGTCPMRKSWSEGNEAIFS